jgi:hypothetical protein
MTALTDTERPLADEGGQRVTRRDLRRGRRRERGIHERQQRQEREKSSHHVP